MAASAGNSILLPLFQSSSHSIALQSTRAIPSQHVERLHTSRIFGSRARRRPNLVTAMTVFASENTVSNAKLWATLCLESATLLSAQIVNAEEKQIQAVWSQRDVVASKKRVFSSTYVPNKHGKYVASPPLELRDSPYTDCFFSPSRERFLKFSTAQNGGTESASSPIFAELWNVGSGLERCWEIDAATHGSIYTDEWFGSMSWSPDESMVVYVADRAPSRREPDEKEDQQEGWKVLLDHKFDEGARDPFGEGYINKRYPTLFIADLSRGRSYSICNHSGEDRDLFFGEPKWSPDGSLIVATMRRSTLVDADIPGPEEFLPDDFGLRYCYNRYSAIVAFQAPESVQDLHDASLPMTVVSNDDDIDDFCCHSPRFSHDGLDLIYVSAPKAKDSALRKRILPHNATKVLRYARLSGSKALPPTTLIGIPENPYAEDFPGLYLHGLPEDPWLNKDTILFTSTWGSVNKILSVSFRRENGMCVPDVQPQEVTDWGPKFESSADGLDFSTCSLTVLDRTDELLLVSASNPFYPTEIFVVDLPGEGDGKTLTAHPVSCISRERANVKNDMRSLHTVDLVASRDTDFGGTAQLFDKNAHEPHRRFQVTVLLPAKSKEKSPLIVYPHGGPHTATINSYAQGARALLKRGLAVLYVNYRGSLGLGQKSLETLPGNVGTQEVNEIVQATRWALSEKAFHLDPERLGFLGGSHSGFIGAHTSLIPGLYRRTVLRNPVVNIATMVGATDIPDWCFCEAALHSKNENGVNLATDPEQLRIMFELSPVSKVKPCKDASQRPGPILLQVGGSDRRVPPQQSLEWKRTITQAYGSDVVTMRWYPNSGHAIDEVPNGDDSWVHALNFLCQL